MEAVEAKQMDFESGLWVGFMLGMLSNTTSFQRLTRRPDPRAFRRPGLAR